MTEDVNPGSVRPPTLLGIPSYLAGNVARATTRTLTRSLAEHGLSLNQHAVLVALRDFGPMASHEIADRLDVDRSQVVGFVDRLERDGFVTRSREAHDRRRVLISATAKSVEAERRITEAARAAGSSLFDVLSPDELAQLVRLLRKVLDAHDDARLG
ncbi:DNA-binding transcriptional regulator, MarR family [Lentzea xinjiangensis]|uniref:DNA-binding transcriptional regulator, MarR family n=1 Tax=Lentzea xinjiangensis TaxID=402600 RepID=A0A1H9NIZ2_9PSEU|nr:MarR family transcriptional regulator [Lentzea xinjiangensis]SER35629.1 DNA-binding transcriptional regulator, MarR family [Lentzea xinjiangensis]